MGIRGSIWSTPLGLAGLEASLALVSVILAGWLHGGLGPIGWAQFRPEALDWGLAAGGLAPPLGFALWATSRAGTRLRFFQRIIKDLDDSLFRSVLGRASRFELVILAAVAGVAEEMLFRGVLQPLIGVGLTSLAFGLLHAVSAPYFVVATGFGLYLGWISAEAEVLTGAGLFAPALIHSVYDYVALRRLRQLCP